MKISMRTIILLLIMIFSYAQLHAQLEVIANVTDVSCYGKSNGAIDIQVRNGVPPFSFRWLPGEQQTEDLSAIPAGTYIVLVEDVNGLMGYQEIEVEQPDPLELDLLALKEVLCPQQTTTVVASVDGGTGSYAYKWNDPGQSLTPKVEQLTSGSYVVTVTDDNACKVEGSIRIGSSNPSVNLLQKADESCQAANDGAISVSASGGRSPYAYNWSNQQTGSQLENLTPGSYSVTLTDQVGCQSVASYQIESSTYSLIPGIDFSVHFTPVSCHGASDASLLISIQDSSELDQLSVHWQDPSGRTGYLANDVLLDDLQAGQYHVTVTDSRCTLHESLLISEPDPLIVDYHLLNQNDNTYDLLLWASGGNGSYAYSRDGGATFTEQSTLDSMLAGESYFLVVQDKKGCAYQDEDFLVGQLVDIDNPVSSASDPAFMKVYPNPSDGLLVVSFRNRHRENVRMTVFSSSGRLVFDQLVSSKVNHIWFDVDLTAQPKGSYVVVVKTNSQSFRENIILQ